MADFDPFSAMVVDEPTALEMAKARAAALRGQSFAGLVGSLAHDPQIARSGSALMEQAQQRQTQLGEMPGERLRQAMQRGQLQKQQFEASGMQSPEYGTAGRALLKKFGLPVADETPNPAVQAILPIAEKAYSADLAAQARRETARLMATGGASLSPEALEQAAQMYATTGTLPQLGAGRAGANLKTAVANKAAQLSPTANLAANKAGYKADTGSLQNQQKILDNTVSWEHTGKANLDILLGIAGKLHDTGSPWINRPVRTFLEKGAGDPNQTAFKAAHAAVVNEYAKILSGSQGSGGVTEGARHEAESMLPLDATWEQLSAAAQVLNSDAGNRINALRQQIGQTRARVGGKEAPAEPETHAAPTAAATAAAPAAVRPRRTVNGETREWDGKAWVPVNG